jgi:hypothetical protein
MLVDLVWLCQSLLLLNLPITTTVYDAQVTNLNGGTADEGIAYSIKGTNADKFSITAGTGILTYKTIQTSVHDDTITILNGISLISTFVQRKTTIYTISETSATIGRVSPSYARF